MIKIRPLAVVCLLAAGATLAQAQDNPPQVERIDLMKEIGKNTGILGRMAKGEEAYDAAKADAALTVIIENIQEFPEYFPEGSETGHDTRALPAIWTDKAGFQADADALVEAATAAREAAPSGLDAFRGSFRAVGQACGACHNEFRAKKDG